MGMICQLRQVSAKFARNLLDNPDKIIQYFEDADEGELPEEAQGEDLDLDKAWHGLHYLLTGTAWQGDEPSCYLLAGGEQVGDEEAHDVGYGQARILSATQVAAFEAAVRELIPAEVGRRFNAEEMTRLEIYPEIWGRKGQNAQDNYNYLADYAKELQAFLSRAAANENAVVICLG